MQTYIDTVKSADVCEKYLAFKYCQKTFMPRLVHSAISQTAHLFLFKYSSTYSSIYLLFSKSEILIN